MAYSLQTSFKASLENRAEGSLCLKIRAPACSKVKATFSSRHNYLTAPSLASSKSSLFRGQCRLNSFTSLTRNNAAVTRNTGGVYNVETGVRAEISYVMLKPDAVQRGLVGNVISRFEAKGFKLKGLKLFQCPRDLAETHYYELKSKPFFPKLVEYIISGPVVCMAWEGKGVVSAARSLIGKTDPLEALPGTIRGDFGIDKGRNIVHGSDSIENGLRETELWFAPDEILDWNMTMEPWILE